MPDFCRSCPGVDQCRGEGDIISLTPTDLLRLLSLSPRVYASVPVRIGDAFVLQWSRTEPEPSEVDGLDFFEWVQESTISKQGMRYEHQQLEIHGMRNVTTEEDPSPDRARRFYGYNLSLNAPASLFSDLEPVLRSIVASIEYRSLDDCEKLLSAGW
jgi:hypothetical protein